MNEYSDRRGAPRIDTKFLVRDIRHEHEEPRPGTVICETSNISRNGALCLCSRPFPEFVRIRVTLELRENDSAEAEDLECEGVVVRSDGKVEVDGKEMYSFAVFFDRMSEDDRRKIEHYVSTHQSGA